MGKLVLEGSPGEKFRQIEIMLNRMLRRVNMHKATAYLTNFGIHGYVDKTDENGIVVKDMIPIGGTVSYVYLYIEKIHSDPGDKDKRAELTIGLEQANQLGMSKGVFVREGAQETAVKVEVSGGTKMIVKSSKPLEGVWYGLVIDPVPVHRTVDVVADTVEVSQ